MAELSDLLSTGSYGLLNAEDSKKYKIVACVLRNTGSGWAVIDDATHTPINVDNITNDTASINVIFTGIGVTDIGSFIAVPDEALAAQGFTIGSSVSTSTAFIEVHRKRGYQGAYVQYESGSGASTVWSIDSKGDASSGVSGVTWDDGVKALLVRHPASTDLADYWCNMPTFTPGDGSSIASFKILDSTTNAVQTFIELYDGSGTKLTVPDSTYNLYWSQKTDLKDLRLDPNDINTTNYPNSNIWCYGIFEV